MTKEATTPEPILQTVAGLWAAGVLKSGIDLRVFDHIHAGTQEVGALSAAVGGDPQALRILLDALVALGFLGTQAQAYTLTPVSAEFLVSSKPTYIGGLLVDTTISPPLFDLFKDYQRVVTGGHRVDPWQYGAGANDQIVRLTRALFTLGYPTAQALADHLGWAPGHAAPLRLLDVGCGSAVYGLVALTRLPHARLTAQDWPLILPVAQDYAAQLGVAGRVRSLAGDLRTVELGGPYDAVFLGHILHNYPEATGRAIVRKCLAALAPGGVLGVVEFLAERGRPASLFAWLFSAMIHGTTPGGRSFSSAELEQMLGECGARRTEVGGGLPVGFVLGYRD
jgi:2-polyprenyl-3-methyl-5-hydroxy-6-metoxy-1,4-benzoquinol methylase